MSLAITATTASEQQLANEPDKQLRAERNDDHEPKRVSCGPWSATAVSKEGMRQGKAGRPSDRRGEGGMEYATGDSLSNY